jgi:tape measure domain-containing protein
MATLVFRVSAQYDEVIKLRNEISKLEAQLKRMDVNKSPAAARALETQLASTRQQMMSLVTEAGRVGAVMENDLKKKLNSASKASDELTEEIIKQRKIIRDTQDDVRRLSDEYSKMGKFSPNLSAKLTELNRAKAALNEQRYAMGELQDQQAKNRLEVRKLTREYKEFAQGGSNADEVVKSLTDSLKRTAAEFGGLVAIKKFVSDVIDATGKMQQLDVALSTILQSKSKADALLAEISEFAKKTPFNLDEVANGAKQLLAYGSSADNVVDELSMLGDVASGLQIPLGQLIYLYGTLRVQGRAYWRDIQQFQGRGVNVIEEMAKNLGVTQDQIKSLVEEGKIGFKDVEKAFQSMTSEGGKFNNMLENSAGTWPQRIANIEDTIFTKLNEFGNKYKEVFEFGIGTAEDLVESLDDVISVIGALVAAYGTYKAALIAVAVWQKASSILNMTKSFLNLAKGVNVATAAMKAFNITSKANLFGALFSVIAGVTTAVYMFTKRADEATESQKRLNEASANYEKEVASEIAEVDRLFDKLKNAKKGTDEYNSAKAAIINQYGTYLNGLSEEIRTLKNVEGAYDAVTKAVQKATRARGMESAIKGAQEEYGELYGKSAGKLYKELTNVVGEKKAKSYIESIKKELEKTGTISKRLIETVSNVFRGDANYGNSKAWMQGMKNATKNLKDSYKAAEAIFSDASSDTRTSNKAEVDDKSYWEKQKKELQGQLDALSSKEAAGKKGMELRKKIAFIENKLKPYSAEYDNKRNNTSITSYNSKIQQENKISEIERKQAIERAKEAEELENQVEQARINAMADGSDKTIAQREYDNKKELEAIDRAKEEYIQKEIQRQKEIFDAKEDLRAKQNPKYKKRSFDSSNITVDSSSYDLLKEYTEKNQIQNEVNAQKEALNEYLKNYGTYQQKRLAISQEYSDKINKAQSEGERLSLQASMDDALSKLDFEQIKGNMNWEDVFGNLGDMTISQLERIRQQLRNMLSDGNLGLEEYKTAVEQIDKINTAIVEKNDEVKNTLGLILPMTQRRKEIEMEVAEAERTVNSLMHEMMEMQNSLNQQRESVAGYLQTSGISVGAKDIITSNFDNILSQIGGLFGEDSDIYKNVKKSFDDIAGSERKLTTTTQKLVKAQNDEYGARTKLNNFLTSFGNKLQAISDIMSLINSNIQSLPDLFSQLGVDMSSDFGKGISDLANASQSASNFIKDAMSGNFVGALSNGIGAVKGILSGFNNILGLGIGKGNVEYVTELTEKLTDSNDRLRDSIGRLKDKMDESAGGEAIKNYEQAKDAQEQLNRQTLEILKAQMSYTGAHHSNAYYWGEAIDGNAATSSRIYDNINKSLIEWLKTNPNANYSISSVNSYEDMFKLTPEQMAYIRDYNREIWNEITDIGKYDKSEYWENYADLAGQLENLTEQINENLTQVSFDSLRDSFMNTLLDMDADAQDFADDFGEYMMKSLLNYQLGDVFDEDLKKWYDDWAQMMSGQNGNLTDDQMNELKDRWEDMVDEALSMRDSIADITGYKGGSEEQQSASSKGFETMSQNATDELNGRFTALYESNLRIETSEQQQTVAITELRGNISALTAQAVGIYNIADETRTILANSYLELQEIRENTGYSAKYLKDIKADIAEVKRNTSRL